MKTEKEIKERIERDKLLLEDKPIKEEMVLRSFFVGTYTALKWVLED